MVSQTMRDAQVQFTAREFSKELLNQLLHDEEIATTVASWTLRLLASIQEEIGALFVRILQQDQVVDEVNRLADKLVAYLCASQQIQERVGGLLVDAINLQSSRDAAAVWAYDLVMREDVTEGFRDLVVAALQMDAVVEEAQQLAVQVVNRVLSDEGTILEAKKVLRDALEDQELRNSAKESLWSIVIPWGSRSSPDEVKRAVRLSEELASLPALNDDERASLRSLQMRLRAEGRKGARAEKRTEPASEAPPQAASGVSQAKEASQVPEETKEKQARPLELTTQPLKALKAPEAPSGEDTSPKVPEKVAEGVGSPCPQEPGQDVRKAEDQQAP